MCAIIYKMSDSQHFVLKKEVLFMSRAAEDRRTQYSKRMIRESLYELMKEKPLNKISVTEICQRADVNRSTFYSYYTDIYDLHQKITKEFFRLQKNVIKHIKDSIKNKNALKEFTYDDFHSIVYYYLNTVAENTELYKFIFNHNANNSVHAVFGKATYQTIKDVLHPLIEEKRAEDLKQAFTFVAGGTTAILMQWVEHDCDIPIDILSQRIASYYFATFKAHYFEAKQAHR